MGKYTSEASNANSKLDTAITNLNDAKTGLINASAQLNESLDVLAANSQEKITDQNTAIDSLVSSLNALKGTIMSKAVEIDARIERERLEAIARANAQRKAAREREMAAKEGVSDV